MVVEQKNNNNLNKIWVNSVMTNKEKNQVISIISDEFPDPSLHPSRRGTVEDLQSENILKVIFRNFLEKSSLEKSEN